MELDAWIRQEMKRFIAMQAPKQHTHQPARAEETRGQDFEGQITEALEQNRYEEATRVFKELRERFQQVPIEHQEERRQYYHLLQRCYKLIYDYVAERHKTVRILKQMSYNADVFDEQVPSVDPTQIHNEAVPLPSVEEAMKRHREHTAEDGLMLPPMPQFDPKTGMPVAPTSTPRKEAPRPPARHESTAPQAPPPTPPRPDRSPQHQPSWRPPELQTTRNNQAPSPVAATAQEQETPAAAQAPKTPIRKKIPIEDHRTIREILGRATIGAPKHRFDRPPAWKPPSIEFRPPQKKTAPQPPQQAVRSAATEDLITRAQHAIDDGDNDKAQQLLLEARFELIRAGEPQRLRHKIQALESHLAHSLMPDLIIPKDAELFSSAYLKGLEAMARGNYQAAITFFRSRVLQTPKDRAAKIRLTECLEVLHGESA